MSDDTESRLLADTYRWAPYLWVAGFVLAIVASAFWPMGFAS